LSSDKQIHIIKTFLQKQLHNLERVMLKSKKISDEKKQAIMQQAKELKR
jgi:hypothetical protein